jgi:AcrR family transcriptional regulator
MTSLTPADERRPRMPGPERRAAILAVARGLFAHQGYHGTSTGEIARAAGCSEAVLYRHFPSKQDLFAAVLVRSAGQMRSHLEAAVAATPDDPLAGLTQAFMRMAGEPDVSDHLRLRSLAVTMVDEPQIRATLEELREGFKRVITDAVRASQEQGRIRSDVRPEDVGQLISSVGFKAAFNCALGGPAELGRLSPVMETLLTLLGPVSAPTTREGS